MARILTLSFRGTWPLRSAALSNRFRGLRFTSLIMSNCNFRKILIVVSLAGASVLQAETLEQLTGEALRNNPQFRVLQASVESANGGVRTAKGVEEPGTFGCTGCSPT